MRFLDQHVEFGYLRWAEGVCIGLLSALMLSLLIPTHVKYVFVPKVVQKEVVVKVPQYLNSFDKQQIKCLADNAYYEAGNQSKAGKIAVSNVVMNRVDNKRFPKTPCSVIKQKLGRVCQFSWVCNARRHIQSTIQYSESKLVAEQVYLENINDNTHGALFYHADYVKPSWSSKFRMTTKIGQHIFYRG